MSVEETETTSTDETRKPRAFHVGLMRRTRDTFEFKSAGVIGLSPDGGVFIAPMQAGPWRYGPLEGDISALPTSAETPYRPKLHYHRSGRAYATLSGQDLERKSLQLTRLPRLRYAQIFSLHCIRTWELPTRGKAPKLGDQLTAVKRWPDVAVWTVFVLRASQSVREEILIPGLPSVGMLAGDGFTHGIVSLAAYGHEAVLLITVRIHDGWKGLPHLGGTTVAALPWHPGKQEAKDRCFGLWSSQLRNPMITWEPAVPSSLTPTQTTSAKRLEDDLDRLADFTVQEGGLRPRPPVREYDDFAGTPFAKPERWTGRDD
ncbi:MULTISPECIES: hypothetical protein [unclassified Nocardioides]|uniref:hypothetical protein n=1 Tax=unclassified Nocardioides TaxID=2615069 RepID=UPI00005700F1|nr:MULTISPECIES: hypothetical protein [unclassified Nocardioides]ABL81480.1 hypothetical protein Noca_1970 [Nocardioides sp. JS614]